MAEDIDAILDALEAFTASFDDSTAKITVLIHSGRFENIKLSVESGSVDAPQSTEYEINLDYILMMPRAQQIQLKLMQKLMQMV